MWTCCWALRAGKAEGAGQLPCEDGGHAALQVQGGPSQAQDPVLRVLWGVEVCHCTPGPEQ